MSNTVHIQSIGPAEFILDKSSMDIMLRVGDFEQIVDKVRMPKIKEALEKMERVKKRIEVIVDNKGPKGFEQGDRVFLYGPTGTGKTHSILQWIEEQGLPHATVAVSNGFEDIDFLCRIVTTDKGITYVENKVVGLLRSAAEGQKVAILIDEINRGSNAFMNMVLKMIDPVSGVYEINNFVNDEIIEIPIDNITWFATANLGGSYSGTSDLDEALLDRFNKVGYVGYNPVFESELLTNFGEFEDNAKEIVEFIRGVYNDNEIKRPISSRTLKVWAEDFVNSDKSSSAFVGSFEKTVLFRLVGVDNYGNPNEQQMQLIMSKFNAQGHI